MKRGFDTIPNCLLEEAWKFLESDDFHNNFNFYQACDNYEFVYMNEVAELQPKLVSDLRVQKKQDLMNGENLGFFKDIDSVRKYKCGIVEISLNLTDPGALIDGSTCSCPPCWASAITYWLFGT